ncbi:hypothetical protein [Priestia koreensis]|nr:hypothetical protein [Priestia koreensis]
MVPAMIMLFVFLHVAVIKSVLMVFLFSITHISLGNVDWLLASFLVPGA